MLRLLPIFQRLSIRSFSAAAATAQQSVSKDSLMKLRKKTGYSYLNCRKALLQFGDNNLDEAEKWLRELAEKEGWDKAARVGDRETSQGLVSVYVEDNVGAVVELKSETDFVARSDAFKKLVEEITLGVHTFGKSERDRLIKFTEDNFKCKTGIVDHIKLALGENLDQLKTPQNRTLKEALTMTIGQIKENITLGRAEIHVPPPGFILKGHAHPRDGTEKMEMGRFVSLIDIQRTEGATDFPTEKIAHQICQHVIGMDPTEMGSPETEEEKEQKLAKAAETRKLSKDDEQSKKGEATEEVDEDSDTEDDHLSPLHTNFENEDENRLLRQTFLLHPDMTVDEYLTSHGAKLSNFVRIKLGDNEDKK